MFHSDACRHYLFICLVNSAAMIVCVRVCVCVCVCPIPNVQKRRSHNAHVCSQAASLGQAMVEYWAVVLPPGFTPRQLPPGLPPGVVWAARGPKRSADRAVVCVCVCVCVCVRSRTFKSGGRIMHMSVHKLPVWAKPWLSIGRSFCPQASRPGSCRLDSHQALSGRLGGPSGAPIGLSGFHKPNWKTRGGGSDFSFSISIVHCR